jgi:hypothetical protein
MSRVGFLTISFLFVLCCSAQNSKVSKGAAPAWVTVTSVNYNGSNLDDDAEEGYVDLDYERQVSLSAQTRYNKTAIKILSEAGVQNKSEVSVDFDPSYQELVFHTLKIIRGNQTINKLESTKFKIVQQEKDLDNHLYNGSLTAFSFLDDIRKGDVLEYSYSLKGFNPLYNGKYSGFFDVQYSVPIYNLYYKIIVPSGRSITIKNRGTDVKPSMQQLNSGTVYEWKLSQVQSLRIPDHIPNWYDPYPMVMVSEFASWKEICEWARVLYPMDIKISSSLQKKIFEIEQKHFTAEERTVAALRFVQDDIRYTGIEAGENSHRPHHPDQIFNQRFGDCKDKSYLLSVMLRKMGIEANPVFINTDFGKAVANWLPSPGDFDHVTVTVKINKDTYWFDPTISYQRGDIKNISYPNYQCGLVISESTDSLTIIPLKEKGAIYAKETFNVQDMSGLAHLIVRTEYTGKYADNTRDGFKNNSRYEMLKRYKEYYTNYFDKLNEDSISYFDDEASGRVTTIEYYTIKDFWKFKDGITKASLQPFLIDEVIKKPESANRSFPYELNFPVNYKEEIEVNLPEDWEIRESSNVIKTPSSVFKFNYSGSARKVILSYEYTHLKDFIASTELEDYLTAFEKISDHYSFELTYNNNATSVVKSSSKSTEPVNAFSVLYTLLVVALIITIVVRRNRRNNNYWR